jgi:ribosome-binding ATPase YchF (GTP1/OBG family)
VKVASFGLNIEPGKYKYSCECFEKLVKKFSPKKVSPYVVEFIGEDFLKADAIVYNTEKKLDFVLMDLEKIENRELRVTDEKERTFLKKIASLLEKEMLLYEQDFSEEEKVFLRNLSSVTYKPCVGKTEITDTNALIEELLASSKTMLFFTAGEKEVHAWEIKKGATAVEAAGKIHTDLARGFIKADIVNCKDLDNFHNLAEARAKGLIKSVDRDYIVQEGSIIEIKFSV